MDSMGQGYGLLLIMSNSCVQLGVCVLVGLWDLCLKAVILCLTLVSVLFSFIFEHKSNSIFAMEVCPNA